MLPAVRLALAFLVLIGAALWLWMESMRTRERATAVCRRACHGEGVQLLDETVALRALRLARRARGGYQVRRIYEFEYSRDGADRLRGCVVVNGGQVDAVHLPGSSAGVT